MSMYQLKIDPKRKFLEIALRGYWDEKVHDAYEREEALAFDALERLGPPTFCLLDLSDFPPQAKGFVERTNKRLNSPNTKVPSRSAVVVPGAIAKLQSDRIDLQGGAERRIFASREAAEAWLFGEGGQRAVA